MRRLLLATGLVAGLSGCGEPAPPSDEPSAPPPRAAKAADAAPAEAKEEYYYNPAGKRDPFKSFLRINDAKDPVDKDTPALQRWDIDKFVLRGVIWETAAPRALLADPDGTGHPVRVGTYVGRNWGKVTSIAENCIVVTEEYQTLDGELVVNPVQVCFPADDKK